MAWKNYALIGTYLYLFIGNFTTASSLESWGKKDYIKCIGPYLLMAILDIWNPWIPAYAEKQPPLKELNMDLYETWKQNHS